MKKSSTLIFFIAVSLLVFNLLSFSILLASSEKKEETTGKSVKPLYGGIYRRGLDHEPTTLDPAMITDIYEEIVTMQIFEGLVQYDENLMVIPCIAEHWESSRDNLRWTFYIRKGVKFHNGREVTAKDFVYSFKRLLSPETESRVYSILINIKGAENYRKGLSNDVEGLKALSKYKLQINLERPFPPLIAALAMVNFSVVPREEVEKFGKDFGRHPVGTGPFIFDRWVPGKEIKLIANQNYHEGRPYLDGVQFKIFPGSNIEEMFSRFKQGELEDSLFPSSERENIKNSGEYILYRRPSLTLRMFVMNNKIHPFDDKRIRKAFNYAINKKELSEKVGRGRLINAVSLIPPGMAGYSPEDQNYPYNPQRARELLKEAGYPDGKGLPVIQFWSSVKSAGPLQEDKEIKRYLENIGIKVHFNYETDWPKFKKLISQGKAPIFKYSWQADVPDPDNIISSLFYSKSPTNRAFYMNPEVDKLIEEAQKERDYQKRIEMYSRIQDLIMDDAPVILLNYLAYERVFQPYVRNFEGNALGHHYLAIKRIWLDQH